MDLFQPIVSPDQFHPNFANTLEPHCSGVRKVLQTWGDGFVDRDGKFVREFQTTYNSSFWELYLYAVLKDLGINVDFFHQAPDFVCPQITTAIEATIASHAHDDIPEWEKTMKGTIENDLEEPRSVSTGLVPTPKSMVLDDLGIDFGGKARSPSPSTRANPSPDRVTISPIRPCFTGQAIDPGKCQANHFPAGGTGSRNQEN